MKGVGHFHGPLHGDVAGQVGIGATHPRVSVALQGCVKVHHLHDAVHPGIGPTGTQGGHPLGSEAAQRSFQLVLDGESRRLALPALVRLPVVAKS